MSYSRIGDGIVSAFMFMIILLFIFVPLGIWKLIDLIMMIDISVGLK